MILKIDLSQVKINKIRKDDTLLLLLGNKPAEIKVKVVAILSDYERCTGCGCRISDKESFKFAAGYYCQDCYKKKCEKQAEITRLSASKRKKQKAYWNK